MGDATDMEHDTEERSGGDAINTEEEPWEVLWIKKDQGANNHTR